MITVQKNLGQWFDFQTAWTQEINIIRNFMRKSVGLKAITTKC